MLTPILALNVHPHNTFYTSDTVLRTDTVLKTVLSILTALQAISFGLSFDTHGLRLGGLISKIIPMIMYLAAVLLGIHYLTTTLHCHYEIFTTMLLKADLTLAKTGYYDLLLVFLSLFLLQLFILEVPGQIASKLCQVRKWV